MDSKLNEHFGEDKTKPILWSTKHRSRPIGQIDFFYEDVKIKQYLKVTYLGFFFGRMRNRRIYGNAKIIPKIAQN